MTAILVINNLRDVETDRASGKRTLAVIVGAGFARREYALLLATAFVLVPIFAAAELMPWTAMLAWLAAPLAIKLVVGVQGGLAGSRLNVVLKQTGLVHGKHPPTIWTNQASSGAGGTNVPIRLPCPTRDGAAASTLHRRAPCALVVSDQRGRR